MAGLALIELNLSSTSVADLTPLREMHTLQELNMSGSKVTANPVTDLSPLRGMPLQRSFITQTQVRNIETLRKLPKLRRLGTIPTGDQPIQSSSSTCSSSVNDKNPLFDAPPHLQAV